MADIADNAQEYLDLMMQNFNLSRIPEKAKYYKVCRNCEEPAPIKVGRDYEVEESAILLDGNSISNTSVLMARINGKKSEQRKRRAAT